MMNSPSTTTTSTSTTTTTTIGSSVSSGNGSGNGPTECRRIAIIGGGVTGLAAAWHLSSIQTSNTTNTNTNTNTNVPIVIELFESSDRMGGHAWTVPVATPTTTDIDDDDGTTTNTTTTNGMTTTTTTTTTSNNNNTSTTTTMVDIGFMVFNSLNYPNMIQWFKSMNVASEPSDMSLAVSLSVSSSSSSKQETQSRWWFRTKPVSSSSSVIEWSSSDYTLSRFLSTMGRFVTTLGLVETMRFISDLLRFNSSASTTMDLLTLAVDDPRRSISIQQYMKQHQYSNVFATFYLYPMMAALWSASMEDVYNFPAVQVISFLQNHQMLQLFQRPIWQTVAQRSETYVTAVLAAIATSNTTKNSNHRHLIHTNAKVISMQKNNQTGEYQLVHVDERSSGTMSTTTTTHGFHDVIFACHPPQTLQILEGMQLMRTNSNSSSSSGDAMKTNDDAILERLSAVRSALSNIEYADSVIYVHSDPTLMPQQMDTWASWNCIGSANRIQQQGQRGQPHSMKNGTNTSESFLHPKIIDSPTTNPTYTTTSETTFVVEDDPKMEHLEGINGRFKAVYVTYWLNRLQNLKTKQNIFVSLNPHHVPDSKLTHHRVIMGHPQFTIRTMQARSALLDIDQYQGKDHLWYCGAWSEYGFHEDGCRSGFDVATKLSGVPLPWSDAATSTCPSNSTTTAAANNGSNSMMVLPPPDLTLATVLRSNSWLSRLYQACFVDLPIAVCKQFICFFLQNSIQHGELRLKFNDGTIRSFGDGSKECVGCDTSPVTLRIFDPWFFVKTAVEYDLGLARSYMAGYFVVEPLEKPGLYHPVLRPPDASDETTITLGDPVGLTRLFLLLIGNRDRKLTKHIPIKAGRGNYYSNAFTNASGLLIGKIGGFINYLRYKMTMDNSERGGSLRNIHAHYDISNDLFRTFLDKETLMYSSAIYDAIPRPTIESSTSQSSAPPGGLVFRGTLEQAQWRKLDTLLARAQVQPGQTLLDIGFGWGGLSIHAAKKYGCKVTGITLSVEQKALAEERVQQEGLQHLITFEVIDYRTFARRAENVGRFDRVLSCEMIEAVGHRHLGEFFWAVERLLAKDGVLVMEAITTPEQRYETYIRSTDFINTIIFPGSCCPSLHALVDAAYRQSSLTLEHIDNIGLHYAQTLAEWRRRFNAREVDVKKMGFDDVFLRAWNYYLTYCEAGFFSQTENCLILVFSRQGCKALVPLSETRSVIQAAPFSMTEASSWLTDSVV